jgi:hypothetical protein
MMKAQKDNSLLDIMYRPTNDIRVEDVIPIIGLPRAIYNCVEHPSSKTDALAIYQAACFVGTLVYVTDRIVQSTVPYLMQAIDMTIK